MFDTHTPQQTQHNQTLNSKISSQTSKCLQRYYSPSPMVWCACTWVLAALHRCVCVHREHVCLRVYVCGCYVLWWRRTKEIGSLPIVLLGHIFRQSLHFLAEGFDFLFGYLLSVQHSPATYLSTDTSHYLRNCVIVSREQHIEKHKWNIGLIERPQKNLKSTYNTHFRLSTILENANNNLLSFLHSPSFIV